MRTAISKLVEHDQVKPRQLRCQGPALADPGVLFSRDEAIAVLLKPLPECHFKRRKLLNQRRDIAMVDVEFDESRVQRMNSAASAKSSCVNRSKWPSQTAAMIS